MSLILFLISVRTVPVEEIVKLLCIGCKALLHQLVHGIFFDDGSLRVVANGKSRFNISQKKKGPDDVQGEGMESTDIRSRQKDLAAASGFENLPDQRRFPD